MWSSIFVGPDSQGSWGDPLPSPRSPVGRDFVLTPDLACGFCELTRTCFRFWNCGRRSSSCQGVGFPEISVWAVEKVPLWLNPGSARQPRHPNFPNAAVPPLKSVDSLTESWRLEVAEEGTGEEGRGGGREGGSRPTLGEALKRILDGRRAGFLLLPWSVCLGHL